MDLDKTFQECVEWVNQTKLKITDDEKLLCYGLFKQATEGNNTKPQPWSFHILEAAKWKAWNKNKDMNKDTAKENYKNLIELIKKKYI